MTSCIGKARMTSAVTVEEDRGQEQQAQRPAFEGDDMEAVRAYMLQLLTEGRGEEAIELLLGLLGQLREEHSSTLVRLKEALRQLYGRRSEKTPASQLQHTPPGTPAPPGPVRPLTHTTALPKGTSDE
jgi:transposase